jgi:hypothetical protein
MRTRIALVAIAPIACITISTMAPVADAQPASPGHAAGAALQLTSFDSSPPVAPSSIDLTSALVTGTSAGVKEVAPVVPPEPVIVDTVTPAQRAAWNRVAMCEEGGNWHADGPRFSGGLGISTANWVIYGGLQYAPRGALATPDQQIMVAQRIQSNPPDQHGCASW